jgi:hypothetical protein
MAKVNPELDQLKDLEVANGYKKDTFFRFTPGNNFSYYYYYFSSYPLLLLASVRLHTEGAHAHRPENYRTFAATEC